MRARNKSATLADVARRAGVSLATASKALSGRSRVAAATGARVAAAARELTYSRNELASGLSQGRSGTVGLLTSDLEGRFSLPILMGAEDTFGAGQVSVFLCDARGDALRERHYIAALLSRRVDGIMVVGSRTDPRPPITHDLPVPVVYVYTPSSDPSDLSIVPDNVGAGRLAVEHLLAAGRRRIAHIAGPANERASLDRARGLREALGERGGSIVYDLAYGEWSERWGRSACAMLLDQAVGADAILCDSDQIARGALDALKERGVAVPRDVAIMGFDNWETIVAGTYPTLTSVDMNLERLGQIAAQKLFAAFEGGSLGSGTECHPCRLAVRGSTTPEI